MIKLQAKSFQFLTLHTEIKCPYCGKILQWREFFLPTILGLESLATDHIKECHT